MKFTDKPGRYFWSNGSAWGLCVVTEENRKYHVDFSVLSGRVELDTFQLGNRPLKTFKEPLILVENEKTEIVL